MLGEIVKRWVVDGEPLQLICDSLLSEAIACDESDRLMRERMARLGGAVLSLARDAMEEKP